MLEARSRSSASRARPATRAGAMAKISTAEPSGRRAVQTPRSLEEGLTSAFAAKSGFIASHAVQGRAPDDSVDLGRKIRGKTAARSKIRAAGSRNTARQPAVDFILGGART